MIGIKGAGMSALANVLLDDGYVIRGSDYKKYIHSQDQLISRNVIIDDINTKEYLKSDIVIIGHSFINENLKMELENHNIPYFEYHDFLSYYLDSNKLISICGSHGKTTITKLISTLFEGNSYLIGDGSGKKVDKDQFFFLESCEYQDHFLKYNPKEIIITNIDYDHVDYFKSEEQYIKTFEKFASKANKIFINYHDSHKINHNHKITFGLDKNADYYLAYTENEGKYNVSFYKKKELLLEFKMQVEGNHFLELLCVSLAFYNEHNYDLNMVIKNLNTFTFPYQRFNEIKVKNSIIIKDYCHHPSQIEYNYELCALKYKDKFKVAIFRPDRTSRLVFFKQKFKDSLALFDLAFVLDLSPTEDIASHSSLELENDKKIIYLKDLKQIVEYLPENKNYSFSIMSSKDETVEENILKEIINSIL